MLFDSWLRIVDLARNFLLPLHFFFRFPIGFRLDRLVPDVAMSTVSSSVQRSVHPTAADEVRTFFRVQLVKNRRFNSGTGRAYVTQGINRQTRQTMVPPFIMSFVERHVSVTEGHANDPLLIGALINNHVMFYGSVVFVNGSAEFGRIKMDHCSCSWLSHEFWLRMNDFEKCINVFRTTFFYTHFTYSFLLGYIKREKSSNRFSCDVLDYLKCF